MNELVTIGNTKVLVADDEFVNAYQSGYLTYKLDYSQKTLSDMDIYNFFANVIPSVRNSGRYNAGYVAGWVASLLEGGRKPATPVAAPVEPDTAEMPVLLQEVHIHD